jgi:hypothetical protein
MAASTTPTSTKWTFLMHKAASAQSYTKLVDIKTYPDMGGQREMLETTTLTDDMQHFIPGIQTLDNGGLQFDANYTLADYQTLKNMEEVEHDFAVWLGGTKAASASAATPSGEDGKFKFSGLLSVGLVGKGVNEVREMRITISPTTDITLDAE